MVIRYERTRVALVEEAGRYRQLARNWLAFRAVGGGVFRGWCVGRGSL